MTRSEVKLNYQLLRSDIESLARRKLPAREYDDIHEHMAIQLNRLAGLYNDGHWGEESREV